MATYFPKRITAAPGSSGAGIAKFLNSYFSAMSGLAGQVKGKTKDWKQRIKDEITKARQDREKREKLYNDAEKLGFKCKEKGDYTLLYETDKDGKESQRAILQVGDRFQFVLFDYENDEPIAIDDMECKNLDAAVKQLEKHEKGKSVKLRNKDGKLGDIDASGKFQVSDEQDDADADEDDGADDSEPVDEHAEGECEAIVIDEDTKEKRHCHNPVSDGEKYCHVHQDQAGKESVRMVRKSAAPMPKMRCAFINQNGKRCSRTARFGNYCWQHKQDSKTASLDGMYRFVNEYGEIVYSENVFGGGLEIYSTGLYDGWRWRVIRNGDVVDEMVGESFSTPERAFVDYEGRTASRKSAGWREVTEPGKMRSWRYDDDRGYAIVDEFQGDPTYGWTTYTYNVYGKDCGWLTGGEYESFGQIQEWVDRALEHPEKYAKRARRAQNFATAPRVPDEVDIDSENVDACPLCGDPNFDGEFCNVCGYEEPPKGFDDIQLETDDDYEQYERDYQESLEEDSFDFDPDAVKLDRELEEKADDLADESQEAEEEYDEDFEDKDESEDDDDEFAFA